MFIYHNVIKNILEFLVAVHIALPVNTVRLHKIITGTYSAHGSYKILYKTNLSRGEYRTMYDNLSTAKNYDLACGSAALGLASPF